MRLKEPHQNGSRHTEMIAFTCGSQSPGALGRRGMTSMLPASSISSSGHLQGRGDGVGDVCC